MAEKKERQTRSPIHGERIGAGTEITVQIIRDVEMDIW
jgi:hypothetical protein